MTPYDAVVIGSGPNGLAAANTLCECGWSVLVLEGNEVFGGGLRTQALTLPGFQHDTFSAVHPAAAASPVFRRWNLHRYGLSWVQPDVAMAHPLADGGCVSLHRSPEATAASLNRSRVGDGDRWTSFAAPFLSGHEAIRSAVLGGFPPLAGGAAMVRRLGPRATLEFLRITLSPALTIAEDLFESEEAKTWFYGLAMHSDLSPQMAGTAVMAVHLALLGHAVGWPSPHGGSASLARALVGRFRSMGGELRVGASVEELLVERGRIEGVRVGGEAIGARAVLCAVSPLQLMRLSGDSLPADYCTRLRRFRPGPGVLKIDWALRSPIPWLAPDARKAGTVHVGADPAEIFNSSDGVRDGKLSSKPFLIVGQQSIADGSRAPEGAHTGWCYTRIPAGQSPAALASCVNRMEAQVERFAPGFRSRILARHVLTPEQMEAINPNLIGGDIGGGSYSLDQMLLRPLPALSPYRTPIHGLYLASASTYPGGSVHGVCGWAAARCALRDAKTVSRWLRRGRPARLR